MTAGGLGGVVGSLGGAQQLSTTEMETTAATNNAKLGLGILKDSSLMSLCDFSKDATWNYKSGADNPTLSAPLLSVRMASAREEDNMAWKEELLKLLKQLPDDVRERLLKQKKLPPEERSHALYVLDLILGFLAKATVWLEKAVIRLDSDSVLESTQYRIHLSTRAIQALAQIGSESLGLIEEKLRKVGANYRHYDSLKSHIGQIRELIKEINDIEAEGDTRGPKQRENLSFVILKIATWNAKLQEIATGSQFQFTKALSQAIHTLSMAAWQEEGSCAFLSGCQQALVAIKNSESATGTLGISLTLLIKELATLLPDQEAAQLLSIQLAPFFLGILALGELAPPIKNGNGSLAEQRTKHFLMEMCVHLALSCGIMEKVMAQIAKLSRVSQASVESVNSALLLTTSLLLVEATAKKDKSATLHFLEELAPHLEKWIAIILEANQERDERLILLEQMQVALKKNAFADVEKILLKLKLVMQFPIGELQKNLHEIGRYALCWQAELAGTNAKSTLPATYIQQVA